MRRGSYRTSHPHRPCVDTHHIYEGAGAVDDIARVLGKRCASVFKTYVLVTSFLAAHRYAYFKVSAMKYEGITSR